MKTILRITFLSLLLIVFSCSKDDAPTPEPMAQPEPEPTPEPVNQAPSQVNLLAPAADAENVDVRPTFSWEAATDPDGDAITYEIYADTTATPSTLIGTTTETNFEVDERLTLLENYSWNVLAKDDKDGESESTTQGFDTRSIIVSLATTTAPFGKRLFHSLSVFNDKIFVIAGNEKEEGNKNDVWSSSDGVNWDLVTSDAGFSPRNLLKSFTYDNKLWIIGGFTNGVGNTRDIWNSEDGVNWNLIKADVGFDIQSDSSILIFDNKIWVIGVDTWFSEDGLVWSLAESNLSRRGAATVFDNKIWVVGHDSDTNLSFSEDGFSWTLVEPNSNLLLEDSPIVNHGFLTFDNKMWVLTQGSEINLFSSRNGTDWELVSDATGINVQLFYETIVYNNKIWIVGGNAPGEANNFQDDVWFID
ncbi:hypothetical protein [Maribacter sp. 2308TA10-17]|uniref:hypothetical protein n=1 Tax=Maribacter sp. 2308TA10-17 TaxID=3386276 RepID=UPI0039BD37E2